MEVAMEDDVYFADLSKQISLLIMDDDDEEQQQQQQLINHSASLSFQQQATRLPRVQLQEQQQQVYTRECKGTGVFIPRSSHNSHPKRRKSKHINSISTQNNAKKFNKHFHTSTALAFPPQNTNKTSYEDQPCNRLFSP